VQATLPLDLQKSVAVSVSERASKLYYCSILTRILVLVIAAEAIVPRVYGAVDTIIQVTELIILLSQISGLVISMKALSMLKSAESLCEVSSAFPHPVFFRILSELK